MQMSKDFDLEKYTNSVRNTMNTYTTKQMLKYSLVNCKMRK